MIPSSYSFVTGEEGELYLYTANNRFNVRESATPSLAIGAHPPLSNSNPYPLPHQPPTLALTLALTLAPTLALSPSPDSL